MVFGFASHRAVVVVLVVAAFLGAVNSGSVTAATSTTVTWRVSSLTLGQVRSLSAIAISNSNGVKTWSKTGSCVLSPKSKPTKLTMGTGGSCTLKLKIDESGQYPAKISTTTITRKAMKVAVFPVLGPCGFSDTWQAPRSGGRKHEGVDIIAKFGTPLYAANNGTISRQFFDRVGSLGGNQLALTAADGMYFYYSHLSTFADGIAVGSEVVAGQVIGYVGSTGSSSTPHLHFEYHPYGGAAVNPYPLIKAIDGCKTTTPPTTIPPTTTTTIPPTTTLPNDSPSLGDV